MVVEVPSEEGAPAGGHRHRGPSAGGRSGAVGGSKPPTNDRRTDMAYAELHCHSNFCFLDGASHPEELAEEAARLGPDGPGPHRPRRLLRRGPLRRGGPGLGLPTVFGAELTLRAVHPARDRRSPTRTGTHLVVLARDPEGYARLGRAISRGPHGGGEKGKPDHHPRRTWPSGRTAATGWCSPGAARGRCRRRSPPTGRPPRPHGRSTAWSSAFGRDHVAVELWDHGDPLDSARNDALAQLAVRAGRRRRWPPTTCTTPPRPGVPLATALAAVRARRSPRRARRLAARRGRRPPARRGRAGPPLRPLPGVVERAAELGRAVRLRPAPGGAQAAPTSRCPTGHTEMTWLRELTERGATDRYGPPGAERVRGGLGPDRPRAGP